MNFLAGVFILVSRQFTIGDFIKVNSTVGKVVEIQTRATILKAVDGTKVIVPNAELFTSQVVNMTGNPVRRVVVPLYVSYDTDISYAVKIALTAIKKHPKIQKKPAPSVVVSNYGDSSIDLAARFWVGSRDGWYKVKCDIMHQMLEEFQAAGIVVPYNISHIETEQDTAQYVKDARETAKKRMEEMRLSKTIETDSKKPGAVAATPATSMTIPGIPVALKIEPEAIYADQNEIDGQA
jgi:small-conductance mechanosensitive channel